jgi:CHASE3 domain sensor protein
MQSRAARLILLCLFLAAITTAAFLFWKGDSEASSAALQARTFDAAAKTIERSLLDVRAAQRGYAAAGQPGDRWISKVAEGLESVRAGVQTLRAEVKVPEAQAALDVTATAINDFAKSDKRAVDYVRNDQRALASDVVFGDGLERSETALASLEQARVAELQAREAAVGIFRSRQVFALTAGAAAAVLAVLLLVPAAKPARVVRPVQLPRTAEPARPPVSARDLALDDDIVSLPRRIPTPEPTLASLAVESQTAAADDSVPATPAASPVPAATNPTDFAGVASLCVDLARVVDTRALPSLLDRTADILDASGIILWIADPDGRELNPIFAQGYPQQLVNRLGTIPRDAENATAAAFRTSLLQTVMADDISGGAIAAPLVTPGGCVGVMAAEVRHDSERQDGKLAAATIVAAQLATLVGPPSARPQARTASGA